MSETVLTFSIDVSFDNLRRIERVLERAQDEALRREPWDADTYLACQELLEQFGAQTMVEFQPPAPTAGATGEECE